MTEKNEFLDFLGIDITDPAKAKEEFSKKFIPRNTQAIKDDQEMYGGITKGYNEANKVILKRSLKDTGIDLAAYNFNDDTTVKDIVSEIIPAIIKDKNTLIESLTSETKKGTDKKLTELQSAFDSYKSEVEPKITGYNNLKKEYEDFQAGIVEKEKTGKITEYKTGAWKDFKWGNTVKELEKKGFTSEIESKYKVALFDDGAYPTNDKGERFPGKQAGTYKHLSDILAEEGKAAGVLAVTDNKQPVPLKQTLTPTPETAPVVQPGMRQRIVNTATRPQTA